MIIKKLQLANKTSAIKMTHKVHTFCLFLLATFIVPVTGNFFRSLRDKEMIEKELCHETVRQSIYINRYT